MPLPSFLKRKPSPAPERRSATPADDGADVQAARTRARRRLIGAAVLLVVGVVGFPLVFDTQPRPVSVDVPIELRGSAASSPLAQTPTRSLRSSGVVVADAPADAGTEPEPAAEPRPEPKPEPTPEPKPEPTPVVTPAPAPVVTPAAPAPAKPASAPVKPDAAVTLVKPSSKPASAPARSDAERARALLEGAAAAKEVRFVVQIGAFADAAALNQARSRADRSGLKSYTQVVETSAGKRTRLRVGPFDSREAADRAAAKLKSAGLPAAVLTL
ncbi:SPOR domain-containing protein [Rubrivivax gelatinosus]|uniref:Sporulation protein n=1 Tax=Rubrivivax gelatinosus TaxID=28068 RepID=A0ABS1E3F8_RUBGE|nr:SPOR domain-containing protein [Rubrivivax gelatinosus]MBK1715427.1 sporulation protein [Rubrivivax gelatinosus]